MSGEKELDDFHFKKYDRLNYNCSHFVRDLWMFLEGQDICDMVSAWNSNSLSDAMSSRKGLWKLENPVQPCIALFARKGDPPHVGVFMQGMIFHMTETGPELQNLSYVLSTFESVKYYLCNTKYNSQ